MSSEALGHAWRYSAHKNASFLCLIAIADIVNDQNSNQFWMSHKRLADKTRLGLSSVKTALNELEDTGWLVRVSEVFGETVRYRFVFDDKRAVVFDSRVVNNQLGGSQNLARGSSKSDYNTNITKNNYWSSKFEKTPTPPPFDHKEEEERQARAVPPPQYVRDQLRK
jgi:hypothetical protein